MKEQQIKEKIKNEKIALVGNSSESCCAPAECCGGGGGDSTWKEIKSTEKEKLEV